MRGVSPYKPRADRQPHPGIRLGGIGVIRLVVSKDFWSGLMFAGFGVLALALGSNLAVGTAIRMGPGYVPRMLSYILIALGIVILVRAVIDPGEPIERLRRPGAGPGVPDLPVGAGRRGVQAGRDDPRLRRAHGALHRPLQARTKHEHQHHPRSVVTWIC